MDHFKLLEILALGFAAALALGYVTHRLRLSPIVGYLLAGFLIGPNSPGFVADSALAAELAEAGVILLMFGVGLHFDLKDLLAVRAVAVPGAVIQSALATLLGLAVAMAAGLTPAAGLVIGLGLAVASTVVLMRVLMDHGMLDTPHGHVAVGWLIVEDVLTVLALVILPAAAAIQPPRGGDGAGPGLAAALGLAALKLAALWVLVLPVGGRAIAWLLERVARTRSRELFVLAVLALAFAIATGSAVFFGASAALGAFLAGMVVGRTSLGHQAASDLLPMRDAFAVLFFISVGMLFDPVFIMRRPGLVAACLGIILMAKPLIACGVVAALGYSARTALTVALGLAQIGEFSFILAQQAISLNLLPREGYSLLVACALISITLNPLLFGALAPLERRLRAFPRLWGWLNRRAEAKGAEANARARARLAEQGGGARAIVIGYGPVGRRVADMLRQFGVRPVVIDLNPDTISALAAEGQLAVYGDGARRDILKAAGIEQAECLLVTLPELDGAIGAIASARALRPDIRILARARHVGARAMLEELGVTAVHYEEEEVARAMAQALLNVLPPAAPPPAEAGVR